MRFAATIVMLMLFTAPALADLAPDKPETPKKEDSCVAGGDAGAPLALAGGLIGLVSLRRRVTGAAG